MAKRREQKAIPHQISPFVWGYLGLLEKQGVPIERAYLFGSWAKGKQHRWSDIDLAIVSPRFTNLQTKEHALSRAMRMDLSDVEPHGFHPDDFMPDENAVVREIMTEGIRII